MAGYQSKFRGSEVDGYLEYVKKLKEEGLELSDYAKKEDLNSKQDVIPDLDVIRDGASKGATAIQQHQDISHLATKAEIAPYGPDIKGLKEKDTAQDIQIAENKSKIDATSTVVGQLSEDIDVLNGTGEGSVTNTVSTEIAKIIAEAPDALDTLKEIADFIEADETRAAEILTELDDHEKRITKIEQEEGFAVMSEAQYEMLPKKEDKLYFLYED
jgi:hypothetical protein